MKIENMDAARAQLDSIITAKHMAWRDQLMENGCIFNEALETFLAAEFAMAKQTIEPVLAWIARDWQSLH